MVFHHHFLTVTFTISLHFIMFPEFPGPIFRPQPGRATMEHNRPLTKRRSNCPFLQDGSGQLAAGGAGGPAGAAGPGAGAGPVVDRESWREKG